MLGGIFEKNKINEKIKTFDEEISKENFWKDKLTAQKILKEKKFLENIFDDFIKIVNELENFEQLLELALKENDVEHAYIVHSNDGMDEISPFAETKIVELKNKNISEFLINPIVLFKVI